MTRWEQAIFVTGVRSALELVGSRQPKAVAWRLFAQPWALTLDELNAANNYCSEDPLFERQSDGEAKTKA
jgi:hypothetical protein